MPHPALLTLASTETSGRYTRTPRHKSLTWHEAMAIQPFMIAPVLPGETLTGIYFEAREVSKPLKSPLLSWSSEFYWFYVRIRDLNERDTLDDLFINPAGATLAASAANAGQYYGGVGYNYTEACLRRVTETYFRDEGETWNTEVAATGIPKAQILDQMWLDSVIDATVLSAGTGDPGATTTPEALDVMMEAYEYLRGMQLTNMSFEDYLATFGVRQIRLAQNKPVLIKRLKQSTYPSNTIDPATGAPSSAISFVFKESISAKEFATGKALYMKEPGFIFGVHVNRPKIYFENQVGSLSHHLDTAFSWLPAIMADHPETSLREFTNANGPLTGTTNGYWVDMRDLFMHGDQFRNLAGSGFPWGGHTDSNIPTAAIKRKYMAQADVGLMFVSANGIQQDSVTQLSIRGSQQDYTRGSTHEF